MGYVGKPTEKFTDKVQKKKHRCQTPHIKSARYPYSKKIIVPVGTIWECDECYKYYRAREGDSYQSSWVRIYPWNLIWSFRVIKFERNQREEENGNAEQQ